MTSIRQWTTYGEAMFERVSDFAHHNPEAMRGLKAIENSARKTARLDPKTHELIALAVAVTTRCDGCIAHHVRSATALGVTREEIAEALGTAIALNAGAALTYSAHVFDALDALSDH